MKNESFPKKIKGNNCIFDIHNSFSASSFTRGINQPWELVAAGQPFPAYSCMHSSVMFMVGGGKESGYVYS